MTISFKEFINKYLGKMLDWDGVYGGQCVDLFRYYVHEVCGFEQPVPVAGAKDLWGACDPDDYEYILNDKNDTSSVPQYGDIIIWNYKVGGGYGHVSMFIEGNFYSFTSFDQNWPTLNVCTKTQHNYINVIGWLRPRKEVDMSDMYTMKSGNKLDLDNKESMKAVCDLYDEVMFQNLWIKKEIADKECKEKLEEYKKSVEVNNSNNETGDWNKECCYSNQLEQIISQLKIVNENGIKIRFK